MTIENNSLVEVRIVRRPDGLVAVKEYWVSIKLDGVWRHIGRYTSLSFARKLKAAIERGWDHGQL